MLALGGAIHPLPPTHCHQLNSARGAKLQQSGQTTFPAAYASTSLIP